MAHHPAWVGHHTGGSRSKPTVHPCPLRWGGCGLLTSTPTHNNEPKKTQHDNNKNISRKIMEIVEDFAWKVFKDFAIFICFVFFISLFHVLHFFIFHVLHFCFFFGFFFISFPFLEKIKRNLSCLFFLFLGFFFFLFLSSYFSSSLFFSLVRAGAKTKKKSCTSRSNEQANW